MPIDPYQAEVTKFRQDRESTLKSDTGWLTIGGLWFLTQPQTTFGSDPLNDIVFPASAPGTCRHVRDAKRQGHREGGRRRHLSARRQAVHVGRAEAGCARPRRSPVTGKDLQFWVHNSGDRLSIRLRDQNNPLRKEFRGHELVSYQRGVSRRGHLYAVRQTENR